MDEVELDEHEVTGNYGERFVSPDYMREFMEAHPEWMRKRFVINDKATGAFLMAVYAERFEEYAGIGNSFTGARIGTFYIGDDAVATVELAMVTVQDSGGRAWDKKRDIMARARHELSRLADIKAWDEKSRLRSD